MTANISEARKRLAIALDTDSLGKAIELAEAVSPYMGVAKVGLELYDSVGKEAVEAMRELGFDVFLDVKLHDIPTTVRKAAKVLGAHGASYLTIHASGGEEMLRAGIEGLKEGAANAGHPVPVVLAITVLTSDKNASPELLAERMAVVQAADCPGVVCAADDLSTIKNIAPQIFAVTPGIRPAGVDANDQNRIATPGQAIEKGSDLLVIGRALTQAPSPAQAAADIAREVSSRVENG